MGRGVKGKGREKGGRGGKREGPPCSQPPLLKNPGYGPACVTDCCEVERCVLTIIKRIIIIILLYITYLLN